MSITKISAAMTDLDGAVTINNSGADADFIVESDDHSHMLFVDAGNNAVGIKNDSPHDASWAADGANTAQLSIGNTSSGSTYGILHLLGHNTQATRYSIGAGDGMLYLAYDDVAGAHRIKVQSDGDVEIVDGNIIMASGHGIDFSATSNGASTSSVSELLDDYEEGTWTPAISSGTATFSEARYTKIGRLVRFSYQVQSMDDITSNNHIIVTGLPFPVQAGESAGVAFGTYTDNASSNVVYATTAEVVYLYAMSSAGWDTMTHAELNSNGNYQYVAGTYQAES